jgi:hypothetical protein
LLVFVDQKLGIWDVAISRRSALQLGIASALGFTVVEAISQQERSPDGSATVYGIVLGIPIPGEVDYWLPERGQKELCRFLANIGLMTLPAYDTILLELRNNLTVFGITEKQLATLVYYKQEKDHTYLYINPAIIMMIVARKNAINSAILNHPKNQEFLVILAEKLRQA